MSKKTKRPHHHHERTEARRLALQMLYQSEMLEKSPSAILDEANYVAEEGVPSAYAQRLLRGVEEHREEIDDELRVSSENWTLSRMSAVDRSLLRVAVYEMLYVDEVPLSVSINEAVELAKSFGGGDDSHRFVNGILGRIARSIEAEGKKAAEAQEPALSAIDMVAAAFAREQQERGDAEAQAESAAPAEESAAESVLSDDAVCAVEGTVRSDQDA